MMDALNITNLFTFIMIGFIGFQFVKWDIFLTRRHFCNQIISVESRNSGVFWEKIQKNSEPR